MKELSRLIFVAAHTMSLFSKKENDWANIQQKHSNTPGFTTFFPGKHHRASKTTLKAQSRKNRFLYEPNFTHSSPPSYLNRNGNNTTYFPAKDLLI